MSLTTLYFTHLPAYARFIREQKLDEFARKQLEIARELHVPLLRFFSQLNEEELINFGKATVTEFLVALEENTAEDYMERSIQNWMNNQLPMLTREQIVAEDIASISLMRRRSFRFFLQEYSEDISVILALMSELDDYSAESEARSFNIYLALQNEEIRKINDTLRASNADLEETQQIARLGSFEWYPGHGGSIMSPTMRSMFDIHKRSNLTEFLQWVHPDDREKVTNAMERAFNDPSGVYECEYRYQKNGPEKVFLSRGMVTFDDGHPVKMRGTVMDVTDRYEMISRLKESEAKLQELNHFLGQKNTELQRKNQELESFNYAISHDLQEPLRKIQVFSSMLRDAGESGVEAQRVIIDKVHTAATRLRKLINDLFSFSFILSEQEDEREIADLNIILQDVLADYHLIIEDRQAVIHASPLPVLKARPTLIYQLLQNLVSNAIKYAKAGTPPELEISYEKVKGDQAGVESVNDSAYYHAIGIRDNGIGIEEHYHEKIFSLFQRLHNKREYSGTGIGLAMCRKIMDFYHGFITIKSEPGEGSEFTVYFPEKR